MNLRNWDKRNAVVGKNGKGPVNVYIIQRRRGEHKKKEQVEKANFRERIRGRGWME